VERAAFEKLVAEALRSIPRRFRKEMRNIAIIVEDEPSRELLREMGITPPDTLLGLYSGVPLTERTWRGEQRMPDRISIFQGPHERDSRDEDDLVVAIGETLIHEIGHYFGMSEEQIEAIEKRYWRGDDPRP
jgi:predicted Zn-dependent protease with MMP-like domain